MIADNWGTENLETLKCKYGESARKKSNIIFFIGAESYNVVIIHTLIGCSFNLDQSPSRRQHSSHRNVFWNGEWKQESLAMTKQACRLRSRIGGTRRVTWWRSSPRKHGAEELMSLKKIPTQWLRCSGLAHESPSGCARSQQRRRRRERKQVAEAQTLAMWDYSPAHMNPSNDQLQHMASEYWQKPLKCTLLKNSHTFLKLVSVFEDKCVFFWKSVEDVFVHISCPSPSHPHYVYHHCLPS